jgi:hypothetical protein
LERLPAGGEAIAMGRHCPIAFKKLSKRFHTCEILATACGASCSDRRSVRAAPNTTIRVADMRLTRKRRIAPARVRSLFRPRLGRAIVARHRPGRNCKVMCPQSQLGRSTAQGEAPDCLLLRDCACGSRHDLLSGAPNRISPANRTQARRSRRAARFAPVL